MPADTFVPDDLTLRRFLLGRLSGPEADQVERYLETHPESARTLQSVSEEDAFTSALRDQSLADDADPEVHAAVARLERLLTDLSERTTTRGDAGESRTDQTDAGEVTEEGLQFLAPPQGPNELGRLGGYRVLRVLGVGGMGMVLEADDPKLGRRVAIKVMRPRVATSPKAVQRFLQEARAAATVDHDHIVPIWQIGEDNGVPYIVMPFLKGQSLNARLNREDRLSPSEVIRIGMETAEGLAAAHEKGLVHRDIKPANLWLEAPRGRVKILDFGLARLTSESEQLTQSGAIVGTPAYMAPEQGRGQGVDARSDLFSLGAVLYRMATGRNPFAGTDTMSMLTSLATDTPVHPQAHNPALPSRLSELIVRLLQKDPAKRPPSAREVIRLLSPSSVEALPDSGERRTEFAFHEDATQVEAAPATPAEPEARSDWRSRGRGLTKGGIVVALLALIGVTVGTYKLVFQTKDGTLEVVVSDKETEARFKNGELQLVDPDGKVKYTIKPTDRTAKVAAGEYTVTVVGADGLEVVTPTFTMKKGGQVVVTVTARGPAGVAANDPPVGGDADRKAAEYVLRVGGPVRIIENGKEGNPTVVGDLPRGPFELRIADLTQNGKATDAGLAAFKGCKNLTHLFLRGAPVGDTGLAHLHDCTNLTRLDLRGTQVTAQGVDALKKALPNCKVEWDGEAVEPTGVPVPDFFNGKDLTGWVEPDSKLWTVKGGALVATTRKALYRTRVVYTTRSYRDFQLSFEVRRKGGHAVVSFRGVPTPVADALSGGQWVLRAGGETLRVGTEDGVEREPERRSNLKADDFHTVVIRAVGRRVTVTLNGKVGYDKELADLSDVGSIGFGLGGPTEEVTFRNLRLIDLSPAKGTEKK